MAFVMIATGATSRAPVRSVPVRVLLAARLGHAQRQARLFGVSAQLQDFRGRTDGDGCGLRRAQLVVGEPAETAGGAEHEREHCPAHQPASGMASRREHQPDARELAGGVATEAE